MQMLWLARFISALYLLSFAIIGLLVAYIGYCDPDTCWHLALGRFMLWHGLPQIDLFSSNVYSFVHLRDGLPLIQHEWLSDLLFFAVYAGLGAKGLSVAVSCLSAISLVLIPGFVMQRNGVPRLLILICTILVTLASGFRLWVRPEQFSFLYLSLFILTYDYCLQENSRRTVVLCYFAAFAIMILWTNSHALFLVGLAYSFGRCLLSLVDKNARVFSLFLVSCAATFFTPWHLEMWRYIFKLIASPITYQNKENGPITLTDLGQPTFWPFLLLLFLGWSLFTYSFIKCRERVRTVGGGSVEQVLPGIDADKNDTRDGGSGDYEAHSAASDKSRYNRLPACRLDALLLLAAGTEVCLIYRRLTPIGLLVFLSAVSTMFQPARARTDLKPANASTDLGCSQSPGEGSLPRWLRELFGQTDHFIAYLGLPVSWKAVLTGLTLSALSCYLAGTFLVPPIVPSPSRLFHPPYQAIAALEKAIPRGRMLNDSKFGSMMTWVMKHPPDIFIDGRFDSFERVLVADYNTMRLCKPGWQELMARYDIGYVFFPPDAPIIRSLINDPGWCIHFSDSSASILVRCARHFSSPKESVPQRPQSMP
jgi:hypothetical protein